MNELPLTLECKRIKIIDGDMYLGEIVNAVADERILDANGNIDVKKLDPIVFDRRQVTEMAARAEKHGNLRLRAFFF